VEEFPLLERLYEKHKGQGFAVVSINIEPGDNGSALELMRLHRYPFTALTTPDPAWRRRYKVESAPANFLLDRTGRIVLKPAFGDPPARAIAEGEIDALVARQR
jgi:hypothetical protein